MSLPRTEFPPHPDPHAAAPGPTPDRAPDATPDTASRPDAPFSDAAVLGPAALGPTVLGPTVLDTAARGVAGCGIAQCGAAGRSAVPARPVSAALRASYADPARAQAVPAGPLFDVVSVGMDVGLETLDLMLRSGVPLGPVAADGRSQVRRVGFLLPPGSLARLAGFAWWCRSHGMRTATHGDVVALPPLIGDAQARLQWLVPPDAVSGTDPALLLSCLRRALGRRRLHAPCQVSAG